MLKNKVNKKKKKAFTLAEVLITLGIIGVVAALTIPTLVENEQKVQYATGLKKAYMELQTFFKQYIADEGVTELRQTDLYDGVTAFADASRQDKFDTAIKKYFKVLKTCKIGDGSCNIDEKYLTKEGTNPTFSGANKYVFYTADGIAFAVQMPLSCNPDNTKTGKMKALCGNISVDVNGAKSPNREGRDFHVFFAIGHDGTLFPMNGMDWSIWSKDPATWESDASYWKVTPTCCGSPGISEFPAGTYGQCIPRIMEDGWQMNY